MREYDILDARRFMPLILPSTWHETGHPLNAPRMDVLVFRHDSGMHVMLSAAKYGDGRNWLHVSLSRRASLPSYDDMVMVKDVFIGASRTALQVFPAKSKHVNIHKYCLHLWHCLDGDVTPDFTDGMGTI